MLVSIFVPTGNRAASLKRMLESVAKQTYRDFEVIIVDYKSRDKTPEVIATMGKKISITYVQQKQKGLAAAANLALNAAEGAIFIRTDDDVVVTPGWLEAIVSSFKTDKKVGGVTGPTIIPQSYREQRDVFLFAQKMKSGSLLWKWLGRIYFDFFLEQRAGDVSTWLDSGAFTLGSNYESARKEAPHEITNLEACNFSVRTVLLRKVNGFDEDYSGVGEYHEADAAYKIRELGYKLIFNPKAELNHLPSQDGFFSDRPSSYPRMINFIVFYLRHIKLNSWRKLIRFSSYVVFQNCYYIYTALSTRQLSQLGALPATLMGGIVYLKRK